jgi:isocitrate/isopropylmalate dehydrogenase
VRNRWRKARRDDAEAMAKAYPEVQWDKYHIDILTANFVLHPDWFDVVFGSNLIGDKPQRRFTAMNEAV